MGPRKKTVSFGLGFRVKVLNSMKKARCIGPWTVSRAFGHIIL